MFKKATLFHFSYIYIYIYIYISYIIHSQIKKDYHQVAESIMVPGNKTNPKKIKKKKKKNTNNGISYYNKHRIH